MENSVEESIGKFYYFFITLRSEEEAYQKTYTVG